MRSRDAEVKRRGHDRRSIFLVAIYFLTFFLFPIPMRKYQTRYKRDAGGSFCIFLYSHILSRYLRMRAIALLYISIIVAYCSCIAFCDVLWITIRFMIMFHFHKTYVVSSCILCVATTTPRQSIILERRPAIVS